MGKPRLYRPHAHKGRRSLAQNQTDDRRALKIQRTGSSKTSLPNLSKVRIGEHVCAIVVVYFLFSGPDLQFPGGAPFDRQMFSCLLAVMEEIFSSIDIESS
jgi:hypothetical protein